MTDEQLIKLKQEIKREVLNDLTSQTKAVQYRSTINPKIKPICQQVANEHVRAPQLQLAMSTIIRSAYNIGAIRNLLADDTDEALELVQKIVDLIKEVQEKHK